jgi:hypothetical protein
MDFCEFIHIKKKVLRYILTWYIEGYSIEEIYLKLSILKYNLSENDINEILDFLIECNF